jgi:hypothetical protein
MIICGVTIMLSLSAVAIDTYLLDRWPPTYVLVCACRILVSPQMSNKESMKVVF